MSAWLLCIIFIFPNSIGRGDQDIPHEPLPKSWTVEAELTDVFFLNQRLGWAVGAQGVVIRTVDGGETWREISQAPDLAASNMSLDQKIRNMRAGIRSRSTGIANDSSAFEPIRCRFESVCFVDENHGWVAGGYEVPYVNRSRAVVMRTSDGGLNWETVNNLVVPRFNRIQFTDRMNGWAIGQSGNLFQSGTFFTSDGGNSWSSQQATDLSDKKLASWQDAERTRSGFVTLNDAGQLGTIVNNVSETTMILGNHNEQFSDFELVDDQSGWAAGNNGSLLKTENGGLSWKKVAMPEINSLVTRFDLKTVSCTQSKTWLAGDPGSFLFCHDSATNQTTAHRTPIQTRINKVHFVDEQTGWAVGAFGIIIGTVDGGQNWKIQRGTNQRVAMLCVAPDIQSLPFEILSKYATEESHLCATLILDASGIDRQIAIQALERLGNTTTNTIDFQVRHINNQHLFLERVVRTIRTLRPNVIVCNSGHIFTSTSTSPIANPVTLVKEAIRLAADNNAFSYQVDEQGLKSWQVDRLAFLDPTGTISVDPSRLLPRTGVLVEDQIAISRALIGKSVSTDRAEKYRVTHFTNRDRMKAGDLLSGLDPRNKIPSRESENIKRGNLTMIQTANAKHKKFEQFAKFEVNAPQDLLVWRQQVRSFAMTMDRHVAGVWLMQLAERYLEAGKTELAASAATLLVTHWPDHAFAPASLTWLAQYYASDEFGQIEFRKRISQGKLQRNGEITQAEKIRNQYSTTPQMVQQNGTSTLVWVPTQTILDSQQQENNSDFQPGVEPASFDEESAVGVRPTMFDERLKLASRFLSQLGQRDPELVAGSQYKFLEAQISRRLNGILSNEARFKNLVQKGEFESAGISLGARRELALNEMLSTSKTPVAKLTCRPAGQRPKLDGMLDEPFWQTLIDSGNAIRPKLNSEVEQNTADTIALAYDDQFLYVGIICQKMRGHYYNSRDQARPRDADLNGRDRVELSIDIDRDYRSANQFVIDHRGWVQESCTGSIGWNPDWYVSQSETETSWTVEIAIPLEHLIPGEIDPGTTWAFRIARRAFDHQNFWSERDETPGPLPTGIQLGLQSRPRDFELIRFAGSIETNDIEKTVSTRNDGDPIEQGEANSFTGQVR